MKEVLGSIFKPITAASSSRVYNSQNLPILKGTLNADPHPTVAGAVVVDNDALVAQDSPAYGLSENVKNKPSSDQISVYTVHAGDTIASVAKMFEVSVNTIRWANNLSSNTLKEGQVLTILPVSGVRHEVKKGDTVQSIAKKYKADIDDVLSYNNISLDTKLAVGDIVIVPDGEIANAAGATSVQFTANTTQVVSGYYLRPVPGPKTQGIHGHNAVDLGSPVGTPIVAAAPGTVIISKEGGWNGAYGSYVVIQHDNGTQTLYAHNKSNTVSVGQRVERGQIIGYVGMTGRTTGPHVHFEVRGARNPF